MADEIKAGAAPAKQKVYVRAVPRPGFGGFYRLGRNFSSGGWAEVEASPADLASLREVPQMLVVVDQRPGDFADPSPIVSARAAGLPQQPGAPPGGPPPPEAVHHQGPGDAPPHDAYGLAGDKGGRGPQKR